MGGEIKWHHHGRSRLYFPLPSLSLSFLSLQAVWLFKLYLPKKGTQITLFLPLLQTHWKADNKWHARQPGILYDPHQTLHKISGVGDDQLGNYNIPVWLYLLMKVCQWKKERLCISIKESASLALDVSYHQCLKTQAAMTTGCCYHLAGRQECLSKSKVFLMMSNCLDHRPCLIHQTPDGSSVCVCVCVGKKEWEWVWV